MNYEAPELIEIGTAEEVVLGSKKPLDNDMNVTGVALESVDEDAQ